MAHVAKKQIIEDPSQAPGYFRNIELFSNLSDREVACFKLASQSRLYKKDKIIYLQEDAADYFYIICSGWVKLFHTMPEGEEVIVDMLTAGQMFGESAIFVQDLHMCGAQIIGDAQIVSVPSKLLREQIHVNPALGECPAQCCKWVGAAG
jgi:CRP-like cAMP-binding protein